MEVEASREVLHEAQVVPPDDEDDDDDDDDDDDADDDEDDDEGGLRRPQVHTLKTRWQCLQSCAVTAVSLILPIGFSCVLQQLQYLLPQFHCLEIQYVLVFEAIRDVDAVFTSIPLFTRMPQRLIIGVSCCAITCACRCLTVSLCLIAAYYVPATTAAVAICFHSPIILHCFQGMVTHCIQVSSIDAFVLFTL